MARPAPRHPTDAPTALLDAAEGLFAAQGFAATTIKQIGAAARLNPALLYYYYPDKLRLYEAVLDRRFGAFARALPASLPPGLAPLEGIRVLMTAQATVMRSSPHLPRLLARELADHDAAVASPIIRQLARGPFRRLAGLIAEGQQAGIIRRGLDPALTAISVIAQVAYFFIAHPIVSRVLGHEGRVPPAEIDRYTEHAVGFALAAVTVPPAAPGRRPRARAAR